MAKRKGLGAIALTDHDTVDGIPEFLSCSGAEGPELVPGVEISCEHSGTLHILGYFVDRFSSELLSLLSWMREGRSKRNEKIVENLRSFGFDITMEEVQKEAGGEVVGRPHMASVLLKKGYVKSLKEAFEKFLKKGGPCYEDRIRPSYARAISVIRASRGVPVLAHPVTLGLERDETENFVRRLRECGLEGIEAYYPDHTDEDTLFFISLARKFDLVVTGGTDFHGDKKPDVELGMLPVPFGSYLELRKRWEVLNEAK